LGWGNNKVYVSKDYGNSWIFVRDNVYGADWCHAGLKNIPIQRVCFITDVSTNEASGGGSHVLAATLSLGNDITVLLPALRTLNVVVHPRFLFAIAADTSGNVNLYVSTDGGNTFNEVIIFDILFKYYRLCFQII
jgi:hypothetical protein